MQRLLLAGLLLAAAACGSAAKLPPNLVSQRANYDCGTAALAMLARVPYEFVTAQEHALGMEADEGKYQADIIAIAGRLGIRLSSVLTGDWLKDEGLIVVTVPGGAHIIYLFEGRVYDPADNRSVAYTEWQHDKILYFLKRVR